MGRINNPRVKVKARKAWWRTPTFAAISAATSVAVVLAAIAVVQLSNASEKGEIRLHPPPPPHTHTARRVCAAPFPPSPAYPPSIPPRLRKALR